MSRSKNKNSKNILTSSVHLGDNIINVNVDNLMDAFDVSTKNINYGIINAMEVHIGDKIFNISLLKYKDYKKKVIQLNKLQEQYNAEKDIREKIRLNRELIETTVIIERIKRGVFHLSKVINEIKPDSERLRLAIEYFLESQFDKAREVLDINLLLKDKQALTSEKDRLIEEQKENEIKRFNNSNEFLLLAELTTFDYNDQNWFEKTIQYYRDSIELLPNALNNFSLAYFLQTHNKNSEAIPIWIECVKLIGEVTCDHIPRILNNLGWLYYKTSKFENAEKVFFESIEQGQKLAETNSFDYQQNIAKNFSDLGLIYSSHNDYNKAEKAYKRALKEYKKIKCTNPLCFDSAIVTINRNLGQLYLKNNKLEDALKCYSSAFAICDKSSVNFTTDMHLISALINIEMGEINLSVRNLGNADFFYNKAFFIIQDNDIDITYIDENEAELIACSSKLLNYFKIVNQDNKIKIIYDLLHAIYRKLSDKVPHKYEHKIIRILHDYALFLFLTNNNMAESKYIEAIKIYEITKNDPQMEMHIIAKVYYNLGTLYASRQSFKQAKESYITALNIQKELSTVYELAMSKTLIHIAKTYLLLNDRKTALKYIDDGIIILKKRSLPPFSQQSAHLVQGDLNEALMIKRYALMENSNFCPTAVR